MYDGSVILFMSPFAHMHMQDEHVDYQCVCAPDYSGRFCQIHFPFDINECDPSPCLNGASCIVSQLSYFCSLRGQMSDFIYVALYTCTCKFTAQSCSNFDAASAEIGV